MLYDDLITLPPSYKPCSAVRITPYTGDGPDHDQAVTYRFEKPIAFAHSHRISQCPGTTLAGGRLAPGLVGFTIPENCEEAATAHAVAQGLWQRRGTLVAVDLWERDDGDRHTPIPFMHVLIPLWKRLDPDSHPGFAERPGHRTIALGECHATPRPAQWPHPDPSHGASDIPQGTQMVMTLDTAPPPGGFPAPLARPRPDNPHPGLATVHHPETAA